MTALLDSYDYAPGFQEVLVDDLSLINGGSSYTGPTGQNNTNGGPGIVHSDPNSNPWRPLSITATAATPNKGGLPGGLSSPGVSSGTDSKGNPYVTVSAIIVSVTVKLQLK